MSAEPQQVHATARFFGLPGLEQAAAEAWAFELTYYFLRGVGAAPVVSYENGIYTCTGLIQTTHPADHDPLDFTPDEPWDLLFSMEPTRQARLRDMYEQPGPKFDGRDKT